MFRFKHANFTTFKTKNKIEILGSLIIFFNISYFSFVLLIFVSVFAIN
jgi:hypothetical protein